MSSQSWTLSPELRLRVASRAGANLCRLAFEAKKEVTDADGKQIAERLERDAYAAAQAQASTTTGTRPTQETTKIYTRKLAELLVECAKRDTSEITERTTDETVFDLSGGSRDFLSKESAEALFRPLLEQDAPQIDTIVLSSKSFGVDAADVTANALKKVSGTLRVANLSDIIGGRPEREALEVLEKLSAALSTSKLRQVDLSNNALGEKGLRACKSLFASQASLESLSLHNVGCSPDACDALHELTSGMQLKELLLYNNMSGDEGGASIGKLLAKMPSMERFQMASSRVGSDGVCHLVKGLCSATGLLSLDLNDNPATEECIPEIITLLQNQHQLRRLNLSDTSLGDQGVRNLAAALVSTAPDLEELELALNEIALEGSIALGRAVAVKKKLRRLDLRENEMEDAGVMIIANALSTNTSLEEMNINCNSVHRIGAVSCARTLKGKPNFKHLSLDENQISTKGIADLKAILCEMFGDDRVLASLDENEDESDDNDNREQLSHIDVQHSTLDDVIDAISALSLNA